LIALEKLSLSYDGKTIVVRELDLSIAPGSVTALVGPNGCGKSTLLRGVSRLLKPTHGSVYLNSNDIHKLKAKDLARQLGILPQSPTVPEGLTVHELVAQGRYPHQSWFQQWSSEDERIVNEALTTTNLALFADRPVDTLSGGQRQRAWIAMALAQQTEILLLDEPTIFLDLAWTAASCKRWSANSGRSMAGTGSLTQRPARSSIRIHAMIHDGRSCACALWRRVTLPSAA